MGNFTEDERPVEHIECMCGDANHVTRFVWWRDECYSWKDGKKVYPEECDKYWHEISIETQLNLRWPWWRRIWLAIKYIFGMQCRYGHWNEATLSYDEVKKLKNMCERFLADQEAKNCWRK